LNKLGASVEKMDWRCVVTGHDGGGAEVFLDDSRIEVSMDAQNYQVGRILTLAGLPASPTAGAPTKQDSPDLAPGAITVSAVVMQPTGEAWDTGHLYRTSTTLDFIVVVEGELIVGFDDGELSLSAGAVLIERGANHRMRAGGGEPVRMVVAHLHPDPAAKPALDLRVGGVTGEPRRVRRVVSGVDDDGRSVVVHDGDPATSFVMGDEDAPAVALSDMWETGGPVARIDQGGDPDAWELEPLAGGVKIIGLEMTPVDGPAPEGWHTTATIDVDIVIAGQVEMSLPNQPAIALAAGDILVQRATNHRWHPVGDEQFRMITVMIAALA
jgi:quercetin dioxygenase-like cupin family protein